MLHVLEYLAEINLYLLLSRATEEEEGLFNRGGSLELAKAKKKRQQRNKQTENNNNNKSNNNNNNNKNSSIFVLCFNVQEIMRGLHVLK